jgi:cytochrome c oxidase cbb3-type subunit IV
MTYEAFRQFADSWGLLFMVVSFVALVGWVFLPRNRHRNHEAANMIFRDGDNG